MPVFEMSPVGYVRSTLISRLGAPRQAWEGAPSARLEIDPQYLTAMRGIEAGQAVWILTWLHESKRSVQEVHPRGELQNPLTGVFATRSPDRPNPIGLHQARIVKVSDGGVLEVEELEAIDGTPIIDIKPVIERGNQC